MRTPSLALLWVALLASATASAALGQQHRVATLETLVPRARSFVVHGVLPLPELELAAPGRTHFALRLQGGGNQIGRAHV